MRLLALLGISIFCGCNVNTDSKNRLKQIECENRNFLKLEYLVPTKEVVDYDKPVVLESFFLFEQIIKYDNESDFDSLPEILKSPGRQLIYKTVDQYGCYNSKYVELIDQYRIPRKTLDLSDSAIVFKVNDRKMSFFTSGFFQNDGVILFNGIDTPVILKICDDTVIDAKYIECYFN